MDKKLILLCSLVLPVMACDYDDASDDAGTEGADSDSDSDSDSGDGDGDGDGDGAFLDGAWMYTDSGASEQSCDFDEELTNGIGNYGLLNTGSDTFEILPGDSTDPFECEMDGSGFVCPERLSAQDGPFSVFVEIEGEQNSATSMQGEQLGRIDCAGQECALLPYDFPCTFTIPFTGTYDG